MSQPNKNRTRANCLRKYRKARGLALTDVAAILGLKSTSTLSRWENGVSLPDTVNALRLSILYRTFVDALFINLAQDIKVDLRKAERLVLTDEARRGAAKRGADYRFDSKSK